MKCEEFRDTLKLENADLTNKLPRELEEHFQSCVNCQQFVQEENFWQKCFAAAPAAAPARSLWPAVAAKIQDQLARAGVIRFVIRSIGPSHGTCICPSIASNCRGCLLLGSGN